MTAEQKQRLKDIASLKKNWNQYDSEPFTEKHIKKVERILKLLSQEATIVPTASEIIQLEYENNEDYLEIDITKDSIEIYYDTEGENEKNRINGSV